jgi:hypothetical protein
MVSTFSISIKVRQMRTEATATYHPSFCVSMEMSMFFFSFSIHLVSIGPTRPLATPHSPKSSMLYTSAAMELALRCPFLTSSAVALTNVSLLAESTLESVSVMVAAGGASNTRWKVRAWRATRATSP